MSVHLAVPFRIERDRAATVADGSWDEVAQNVRVIILTHPEQRVVVPEFGTPDLVFLNTQGDLLLNDIEDAIDEWEPRADVELVVESRGNSDINLRAEVSLREV